MNRAIEANRSAIALQQRVLLLGCFCSLVFLLGCSSFDPGRSVLGSYRNYVETKGKIAEGRYASPHSNFICQVPRLIQPGAVIRDSVGNSAPPKSTLTGTVGFEDDFGTHLRVDWVEIHSSSLARMDTSNEEELMLEAGFQAQAHTLKSFCPQMAVEFKRAEKIEGERAILASFWMPGGGTLASNGKRVDCSRGLLLVRRGRWLYGVSTSENVMPSRPLLSAEQRQTAIRARLDEFMRGMEFK